jgi:FtsH-binding integral membrane protein
VFIGHFALGFAAKKLDPGPSVGTYFLAAQLADTLWPVLLLAGVEHVTIAPGDTPFTPLRFDGYPVSHSLLTLALWGAALAGLHWARKRNPRAALLLGLLVLSHWVLDYATHRPDLPLVPWSSRVLGLGLWYSVPATLVVEVTLFAAGVWLYLGATRARDRVGRYGTAALVGFLIVIYLANVFGPPPPSVAAIAWAGLLGAALILAWAVWVDRHRSQA